MLIALSRTWSVAQRMLVAYASDEAFEGAVLLIVALLAILVSLHVLASAGTVPGLTRAW